MSDRLFCAIRKKWIKSSPEEKIRQALIHYLIYNLHYPLHSIIIEKGLDRLPHLDQTLISHIPSRRIDLLIVAKDLHPDYAFYPLILIECKATPLNSKALRQVLGYNHFLKACFVAVANQQEIQVSWIDQNQNLILTHGLASYPTLLHQAKLLIKSS